jgi:trk system potassium uptake protein
VNRIIARVIDPVHERLLRLMKIEELVHPEADSARRMAVSLMLGVVNSLSLTGGYSIVEAKVPGEFLGRSLQEAGLRSRYQLNLITVRKAADPDRSIVTRKSNVDLIGVPPADYHFEAGDMLVLFGQQDLIDRFLKR